MTVHIRTLGSLSVLADGTEIPEMRTRPVRLAVLLYLALERTASREALMALLWPESDRDHARQALRQTLYALKQDLGNDWLQTDQDFLRATQQLTADAGEAMEALENERPERFAVLYRGHFLEGFHLAESQPFQLWCDQWRARLERMNRRARRTLIDEAMAAGDLGAALAKARRWLDLDPLEDEAQHRVLEILSGLGRGEEASREYERYCSLLAREGLEPLEETRILVEEIRGSGARLPPLGIEVGVEEEGEARPGTGPGKKRSLSLPGVLAAAVVTVGIGAGILLFREPEPSASPLDPRRVLVLPPDNETGDPGLNDLGLLAQEWMTHGVAHMGPLRAVPAMDVLRMLGAGMTEAAATTEREAGTLISGRFFQVGDSLEFHVRISDLTKGEVWHALDPIRISPAEPEPGLRELRDRVAGSLAVRFIPGTALPEPSLLDPPSYPAFQAVMDAAEFVARGDWAGALPHVERAARLDTTFYRARLYVAAALESLGEYARADSVLDALAPSRDRFSEYERLVFQSGRADLRGDWAGRLAASREAARLDPGGTLHYVSGEVAMALGRPREVLELFANLDPDCPWAPTFLSPWNHLTGAYHLLERHEEELEEARRARDRHPDRLEALFMELRALAALGRFSQVRERIRKAREIPPEEGWDAGVVSVRTAAELRAHGHRQEADEILASGLDWYRTRPPGERSEHAQQLGYADALLMAGELGEARTTLEGLRPEASDDTPVLGRLGVVYARLDLRSRLREISKSLEAARGPYDFGAVDYWGAAFAAWSGQEEEAMSRLQSAISDGYRRGMTLHADPFLEPLWPLPAFHLAVSQDS